MTNLFYQEKLPHDHEQETTSYRLIYRTIPSILNRKSCEGMKMLVDLNILLCNG